MRDLAVRACTTNLEGLLERARKRQLTPVERAEIDRLTVVIDTIQAMGASSSA